MPRCSPGYSRRQSRIPVKDSFQRPFGRVRGKFLLRGLLPTRLARLAVRAVRGRRFSTKRELSGVDLIKSEQNMAILAALDFFDGTT